MLSASAQETLNVGNCPKPTLPGGYWTETYNDNVNTLTCDNFVFSHLPAGPGASWGGYYWDGFTYVINGDTTNYGAPGNSNNWVDNQWGCMAGGGIVSTSGTSVTAVSASEPYLVAYWGYHMEEEYYSLMHLPGTPPDAPMHCLQASLEDNSTFDPQGVFICNHPWPYYGNKYGDGFARALKQPGDCFVLHIGALDADGDDLYIDVTDTLAVYDPSEPDSVRQSADWHWVELTDFGSGVKTLYFTMETTDSDPLYGPNTAVYFCMDGLTVYSDENGTSTTQSSARSLSRLKSESISLATSKIIDDKPFVYPVVFTNTITVNSRIGGTVSVFNTLGKEVLNTTVTVGENSIDASKLPAGYYLLRHGSKMIHLVKEN